MARVLLVQDGAGLLSVPRLSMTAEAAGPKPEMRVVELPHPRTGDPAQFCALGADLLELQRADYKYASWLVDQSVQRDGSLFLATRVDPLFLVLPLLDPSVTTYTMGDQLFAEAQQRHPAVADVLRAQHLDLAHLCDVNSAMGEDAFRYSEPRALAWLQAKVERSQTRLAAQAAARARPASREESFVPGQAPAGAGGSGSGAGAVDEAAAAAAERAEKRQHLITAAKLVAAYVRPEMVLKLLPRLGLEAADIAESSASRKRAARELAAMSSPPEENVARAYADLECGAAAKRAKETPKLSVAQKRLAKVDKTGMRSIASFFGGGGAKAKK